MRNPSPIDTSRRRTILPRLIVLAALLAVYSHAFPTASTPTRADQDAPTEQFPAGDGEADDTATLQQAINAGGGLRLPKGVYRLTKPLVVNLDEVGHFSLHGDGVARLLMEGAGPALRIAGTHGGTADPKSVQPNVWDRQRMPLVDGIEIVGRHPEACGIELTGTMQPTITRVTVRDCLHALHLTQRNRNVQVSDCHLYQNRGIGLFLDSVNLHQINVVGCHISYNAGGGIVARGSEIRNLQVGTCDLEGNMGGPDSHPSANIDLDSTDASIAEVAIVGCTIQHAHDAPKSANIRINGRSAPSTLTDELRHGHVTISDNVLSDVQTNIELNHVRGATLTGNTLWQGYENNLLLQHCDALVITGNLFDDNPRYHGASSTKPRAAIVLNDCTDSLFANNLVKGTNDTAAALALTNCRWTTISGSQILDYNDWGAALTDCNHCRINNCTIRDRRADNPQDRAVKITGGAENVVD